VAALGSVRRCPSRLDHSSHETSRGPVGTRFRTSGWNCRSLGTAMPATCR